MQLTEAEASFRALKSELSIRPLLHQKESRVKAHVQVAFLDYALWVTLKHLLQRRSAMVPQLSASGEKKCFELPDRVGEVDRFVPTAAPRRTSQPSLRLVASTAKTIKEIPTTTSSVNHELN